MVYIATKIMGHVNSNIVNQHSKFKFGDIQTKIDEIIIKRIFH